METIKQTIAFSKSLPLDIALFHIAAPYPGTPFFKEVAKNGWFREGTRWEEVDMDESTVLDYPNLRAEELEYWQKRAFREWAMRPGPMLTYLKMLLDRRVDDQVGAERRLPAPAVGARLTRGDSISGLRADDERLIGTRGDLAAMVVLLAICLPLLLIGLAHYPAPWFDEGVKLSGARLLAETGRYGTRSSDGVIPFDFALTSGPFEIGLIALSFKASRVGGRPGSAADCAARRRTARPHRPARQ